jgi:hypothetical protein
VLRIQRAQQGEAVTLTLSGGLTDEYVRELQRVVDAEGVKPVLDLEEVTHVTRDGAGRPATRRIDSTTTVRPRSSCGFCEDHGPFDHVLQLPDVAGP